MGINESVDILMVDDQPSKLLSYRAILEDLEKTLSPPPLARRLWNFSSTGMSPSS